MEGGMRRGVRRGGRCAWGDIEDKGKERGAKGK